MLHTRDIQSLVVRSGEHHAKLDYPRPRGKKARIANQLSSTGCKLRLRFGLEANRVSVSQQRRHANHHRPSVDFLTPDNAIGNCNGQTWSRPDAASNRISLEVPVLEIVTRRVYLVLSLLCPPSWPLDGKSCSRSLFRRGCCTFPIFPLSPDRRICYSRRVVNLAATVFRIRAIYVCDRYWFATGLLG